jgi:hypothetical protein
MNELAGNVIDKSIGFATEKHLRNRLFQSNIELSGPTLLTVPRCARKRC